MASVDLTAGGTYQFSNLGNQQVPPTRIPIGTITLSSNFVNASAAYPLSQLNDGDTSVYWYGTPQNSGGGYIEFDLGSAKIIEMIDIYSFSSAYAISSFDWEGSLTGAGGTWTTLHSHTSPDLGAGTGTSTSNPITISSPGTVPYRYYRLNDVISSSNSFIVMYEVMLYDNATPEIIPQLICQSGTVNEAVTFNGCVTMSGDNIRMNMTSGTGANILISTTGNAALSTSTKQLKTDISPLSDHISVDSILKLEGVQFKYKQNNQPDAGFIAEDLAATNPLFAIHGYDWTRDEKGQKILDHTPGRRRYKKDSNNLVPIDINYLALLATAVEKVKDLDAKIKILKKDKN